MKKIMLMGLLASSSIMAQTITLAEHHAELVEETAQIAWLVELKINNE